MLRTKKKLNLQKQTIRTLTGGQLVRVGGGWQSIGCSFGCENPDSGESGFTDCMTDEGGSTKSRNGVYC